MASTVSGHSITRRGMPFLARGIWPPSIVEVEVPELELAAISVPERRVDPKHHDRRERRIGSLDFVGPLEDGFRAGDVPLDRREGVSTPKPGRELFKVDHAEGANRGVAAEPRGDESPRVSGVDPGVPPHFTVGNA